MKNEESITVNDGRVDLHKQIRDQFAREVSYDYVAFAYERFLGVLERTAFNHLWSIALGRVHVDDAVKFGYQAIQFSLDRLPASYEERFENFKCKLETEIYR